MNTTRQKITKIVDELITFFFNVGSDEVKIDIKKCSGGYELSLQSGYLPSERKTLEDLNRFLKTEEKNQGLEEFFWELAGASSLGQSSELHLVGQMIDSAEVLIDESIVRLKIYKKDD